MMSISITYFLYIIACFFCIFYQVQYAKLIGNWGVLRATVPVQPKSLRQVVPLLQSDGGVPFLPIWLNEIVLFVHEKVTLHEGTLYNRIPFAISCALNASVKLPMRIGISDEPHRPYRVLKLILGHFGNVVEEVVEVAKAVGEVEPHFVGEVIGVYGQQAVLVNGEFSIKAFVFILIIIELTLSALDYNLRGESESYV